MGTTERHHGRELTHDTAPAISTYQICYLQVPGVHRDSDLVRVPTNLSRNVRTCCTLTFNPTGPYFEEQSGILLAPHHYAMTRQTLAPSTQPTPPPPTQHPTTHILLFATSWLRFAAELLKTCKCMMGYVTVCNSCGINVKHAG